MLLNPLKPEVEGLDQDVLGGLAEIYGTRLGGVLRSMAGMGPRYYFRLNSLIADPQLILRDLRLQGMDAGVDERMGEAAFLHAKESTVEARGKPVEADRFAAESVLQGAHLYAPGVRNCHGLRVGDDATVVDERGRVVGCGLARQSETSILTHRQGVAVEVRVNRFGLPSLMDTVSYEEGLIHLQSLPAMVTCRVLDPRPGETVVDLNCAPGGKMSYVCQLTENRARVVGFDRNDRKIEKTRGHLERLGCKNYRLVSHDSRYAHLDYTFEADRVLVDPPCTALGVIPKLFVETTWRDVINLAAYQKHFLSAAAQIAKTGGTIVYSVCTMTGEECEKVVEFGVDELGLVLDEAAPFHGRPGIDPGGLTQRFDPDLHGAGYFIAKFLKK